MYDIAQANEFTFVPSAFVCAYIEQEETSSTSTTSTNSGGKNYTSPPVPPSLPIYGGSSAGPVYQMPTFDGNVNSPYTDTTANTTSKSEEKNSGLTTVVLVLTYGTYRSKVANAANTITAIYTQVNNYLTYIATH
jgi:hypothetical protein